jgi:DNA-binding PadR family transcriptional regulator
MMCVQSWGRPYTDVLSGKASHGQLRPSPESDGALDRLERLGLIESLPADQRRHPYRITAPGAAALRAHLDSLERVSAAGRLRLQLGGA